MSIDWLKEKVPGFADLSDEEHSAIAGFGLLWSLFESRILDAKANAGAIQKAVRSWNEAGSLDADLYDPELSYFQNRYFAGSSFSQRFNDLWNERNDGRDLVESVISGQNNHPEDRVAAVLIIIYRLRNNLFHGEKWRYKLAHQLDNFKNANSALMTTLDCHGRLNEDP